MKPIIPYLMKLANLFLFSAGVYYSVCYLFFVDVPETFFVIISIILLVFSLGSFFIIVNQLIKDEQKSLFLIFTYSSINISLLFSVIYFLIDYVYTSEINQQLLTHLGIQNIIVLHFILLFFFALSLFYQVKPTDCSNYFSYL